jgi:hypothetical protein
VYCVYSLVSGVSKWLPKWDFTLLQKRAARRGRNGAEAGWGGSDTEAPDAVVLARVSAPEEEGIARARASATPSGERGEGKGANRTQRDMVPSGR